MIFGDIDLQAHRDWLEPVCDRASLEAVFPLWAMKRRAVAEEIIGRRIRVRLVCVDTRQLDESLVRVASRPPLGPTEPAFEIPELVEAKA